MAEKTNIERRKRDRDDLMTDSEIARMAKVPVRTVRYWRNSGMLPFVKFGRHPRIWLSDFQKSFHKPPFDRPLELGADPGKIKTARNIRGKL